MTVYWDRPQWWATGVRVPGQPTRWKGPYWAARSQAEGYETEWSIVAPLDTYVSTYRWDPAARRWRFHSDNEGRSVA